MLSITELQVVTLLVSGINALGIGKVLKWIISIETRLTKIETTCKLRNDECSTEGGKS